MHSFSLYKSYCKINSFLEGVLLLERLEQIIIDVNHKIRPV